VKVEFAAGFLALIGLVGLVSWSIGAEIRAQYRLRKWMKGREVGDGRRTDRDPEGSRPARCGH